MDVIRELFLIDIRYSRSESQYYICEELADYILSERLVESLEIFHSLQMMDNLSEVFHFETHLPLGAEHLRGLIDAIKSQRLISLTYNKDWNNEHSERTLLPIILKEFRGRWYLVGQRADSKQIRTYSLDRVVSFTIQNKCAVPPQDLSQYFLHSFGIYGKTNPQPEEVVLRFSPEAGKYIKEAIVHHSQEVVCDNDTEFTIRLRLLITFDFVMEILGYGEHVEVLLPPSLRSQVAERLIEAVKKYQ